MNKKTINFKKVSLRKKKNLFVAVGMRIDFTKEDYKKFDKTLKDYSEEGIWKLEKEKVGKWGYTIMIIPKNNLSAEDVLDFINAIRSMLNEIQKGLKDGQLVYPDDYTNIEYYDVGGDKENPLL